MSQTPSVPENPIAGDDRVAEALAAWLRKANIAGTDDAQLEQLSGVNRHSVKAYRLKTRAPSLAAGLSLAGVLGEGAVNALLHTIQFQACPLDDPGAVKPMQIVADALGHLGVIGQAAADNRIDHLEAPRTAEAADMLIATVLPLSTAGKRA